MENRDWDFPVLGRVGAETDRQTEKHRGPGQ